MARIILTFPVFIIFWSFLYYLLEENFSSIMPPVVRGWLSFVMAAWTLVCVIKHGYYDD